MTVSVVAPSTPSITTACGLEDSLANSIVDRAGVGRQLGLGERVGAARIGGDRELAPAAAASVAASVGASVGASVAASVAVGVGGGLFVVSAAAGEGKRGTRREHCNTVS